MVNYTIPDLTAASALTGAESIEIYQDGFSRRTTIANVFSQYGFGALGSTQGDTLYRGGSSWATLGAGTAGQVLITGGPAANPSWSSSPTLSAPILGTPASGILTNCTGLPLTTGVTGTLPVANGGTGITSFGTGVATWLGTPSSANLRAALTDETGTGSAVFATSPTLVTPILGTPTSGTLTNCGGLPLTTGVSGVLPVANGGTNASAAGITAFNNITGYTAAGATGTTSTNLVFSTSPTLVTPILGTPTSGTLTNCTGLPVSTGISGLGTGVATFLATPSSANLIAAVTDETGTGALVFANTPTLVTPVLGTPTSGTLTNCTGLPVATGISGLGTGIATFLATPSSANLISAVTDETGTGALVFANTPTLVTPNIGAATGTSLTAAGLIKSSSATAGIGYATGAGGTVTQATSKSTGVTLNTATGQITLNNAALASDTTVSFTLTNSAIAATDIIVFNHISGGTAGSYLINAQAASGTASVNVRNITAGSLGEAIVLAYAVVKAVTS